jgi:hypothetical protein
MRRRGNHVVAATEQERPSPSLTLFRNNDRNPPVGALLVFRVRWICRNGKLPEPRSFSLVLGREIRELP